MPLSVYDGGMDDRTPDEKDNDEEAAHLEAKLGGSDPELYARLSAQFSSRRVAGDAIDQFLLGVKELRERCGVPEVVVVCGAFYAPSEGRRDSFNAKALRIGSSAVGAQLAALAFQEYAAPLIQEAEELKALALDVNPRRGR